MAGLAYGTPLSKPAGRYQARLHGLPTLMAAPTATHAANTSSNSRIKLCDKLTQPVSFLVECHQLVKLASVSLLEQSRCCAVPYLFLLIRLW